MNIHCPKCSQVVMHIWERDTSQKSVKCTKCNKLVVYNPETRELKLKEVPQRWTSSGMRFY